mmetsp:Transcript_120299/g.224903  ORF Transcript_120299/g.224903 Transcript_120299/m.224903 type:complete len:86 (-) Transcript_120299:252-509(-)
MHGWRSSGQTEHCIEKRFIVQDVFNNTHEPQQQCKITQASPIQPRHAQINNLSLRWNQKVTDITVHRKLGGRELKRIIGCAKLGH